MYCFFELFFFQVLLKTSLGPIEIELFPKESPLACRNFVGLCLEGYYDNTIFHRISKNFAMQGGDRERGNGEGGTSIYSNAAAEFPNEFNSRLKFGARGMVATTGDTGKGNSSQFFITLASNPPIERKKHSIFGKVVGDTIYNVIKANEFVVDGDERPLYPPTIERAEVINNPFADLRPRPEVTWNEKLVKAKRSLRSKKKNTSLLSFGEGGEEDMVGGEEGGNTLNFNTIHAGGEAVGKTALQASREEAAKNANDGESDEVLRKEREKKEKKEKKEKEKKKEKKKKKKEKKKVDKSKRLKLREVGEVNVEELDGREKEISMYNERKLKKLKTDKATQDEVANKFQSFKKKLAKK